MKREVWRREDGAIQGLVSGTLNLVRVAPDSQEQILYQVDAPHLDVLLSGDGEIDVDPFEFNRLSDFHLSLKRGETVHYAEKTYSWIPNDSERTDGMLRIQVDSMLGRPLTVFTFPCHAGSLMKLGEQIGRSVNQALERMMFMYARDDQPQEVPVQSVLV